MSKNYIKMKKKFIQFFKDRVWAKKKPAGRRTAKKKKVLEKHKQGGHKKGHPQKGRKKVNYDIM